MNEKDKMSPAGRHGAMFVGRGDPIVAGGFHAAPMELGVMLDVASYKHDAPMELGAEAFCKATSSIRTIFGRFSETREVNTNVDSACPGSH